MSLTSAKLNATGHRWLADLSTCNFNIKYRSGRTNIDADTLSRLPRGKAPSEVPVTSYMEIMGLIMGLSEDPTSSFKAKMRAEWQFFAEKRHTSAL